MIILGFFLCAIYNLLPEMCKFIGQKNPSQSITHAKKVFCFAVTHEEEEGLVGAGT